VKEGGVAGLETTQMGGLSINDNVFILTSFPSTFRGFFRQNLSLPVQNILTDLQFKKIFLVTQNLNNLMILNC